MKIRIAYFACNNAKHLKVANLLKQLTKMKWK